MLLSIIFPTIFLTINYLYSTFASPILFEGGVDTGESLTPVIARYIPSDQKCTQISQWYARRCTTSLGDQGWVDVCRYNPDAVPFYMVDGSCPSNTMCQNILAYSPTDVGPVETIGCVPRPSHRSQVIPRRQTGVYTVKNPSNTGSSQQTVSVTLETNLAGASVAALMEGTYWILRRSSLFIYPY
jgi:hypothetical protein